MNGWEILNVVKPLPVKLLTQQDLAELGRIFQRYSEVRAVYLFGSMATGRLHPESDLDLAVVPSSSDCRCHKLNMLTDLARSGFCDVSLVFLDTPDVVLKYEAVRLNRLVYATEEFDRGAYYARTVGEYLDFKPCLEIHYEAFKRRILRGAAGSPEQETEPAR
jgi:uncharacterized protein